MRRQMDQLEGCVGSYGKECQSSAQKLGQRRGDGVEGSSGAERTYKTGDCWVGRKREALRTGAQALEEEVRPRQGPAKHAGGERIMGGVVPRESGGQAAHPAEADTG